MHREVFEGRDALLSVGEMPGVTVEQARLFTDPARRELDMVFQFEHVNLDHGASKWDSFPLDLRDLKHSFGRWQEGLAETGWNSLYWNNHDQPRIVSRWGDDGEHHVRSAKLLGTVLHLHRGTPYVYQGEELGMTNAPLGSIDASATSSRSTTTRRPSGGARTRGRAGGDAPDEPRQRAHADAVGRHGARGLHGRRAVDRRQPQPRGDQRAGGARRPRLGLPPLPAADRAAPRASRRSRDGDFTMLLREDPQVYAFTRRLGETELLVVANFSSDPAEPAVPDAGRWAGAERVTNGDPARPASSSARGRRASTGSRGPRSA